MSPRPLSVASSPWDADLQRGAPASGRERSGPGEVSIVSLTRRNVADTWADRLVRSLVYKRGVGIRETVWVGVWFAERRIQLG